MVGRGQYSGDFASEAARLAAALREWDREHAAPTFRHRLQAVFRLDMYSRLVGALDAIAASPAPLRVKPEDIRPLFQFYTAIEQKRALLNEVETYMNGGREGLLEKIDALDAITGELQDFVERLFNQHAARVATHMRKVARGLEQVLAGDAPLFAPEYNIRNMHAYLVQMAASLENWRDGASMQSCLEGFHRYFGLFCQVNNARTCMEALYKPQMQLMLDFYLLFGELLKHPAPPAYTVERF